MARKSASTKTVETLRHTEDKRKNIPTAEHRSFLQKEQEAPRTLKYPRNTDLDPQLVWRGKDEQDWSDLVVHVPPLYIQEKVNPKVLIDDLLRESKERNLAADGPSRSISSPTSTASPRAWTGRSSTSTTRTGRIA
jgi:adenine-specific DNA-methyltransferase